MRKGNIGVAPEGLPFLFLLALTALAFAALRFWPLALVFLVLTWFSGHFFRDPERVVPSEDDIAVSPAAWSRKPIPSRERSGPASVFS